MRRRSRAWWMLAAGAATACAAVTGLDGYSVIPNAAELDAAVPDAPAIGIDARSIDASVDGQGCISPDRFCDQCDPTLVLCLRFDGGVFDESRYGRRLDVDGSPSFARAGDRTVFAADGAATIVMLSGTEPEPFPEVTIEVVSRAEPMPAARYGFLDRDLGGALSFFLYADGSLRCGAVTNFTDAGIDDGGLAHRACVVAPGRTETFLHGLQVGVWLDAGELLPKTTPIVLLGNDPSGDPFVGAVSSMRIYARAKDAGEILRAAQEAR